MIAVLQDGHVPWRIRARESFESLRTSLRTRDCGQSISSRRRTGEDDRLDGLQELRPTPEAHFALASPVRLSVTRTRIWKVPRQLERQGIASESLVWRAGEPASPPGAGALRLVKNSYVTSSGRRAPCARRVHLVGDQDRVPAWKDVPLGDQRRASIAGGARGGDSSRRRPTAIELRPARGRNRALDRLGASHAAMALRVDDVQDRLYVPARS